MGKFKCNVIYIYTNAYIIISSEYIPNNKKHLDLYKKMKKGKQLYLYFSIKALP